MADEARLVVQVTNQGINETTASLAGLANQARATETATAGLTNANKVNVQANQASGESFGSLALKIAGYSTALNVGVAITRRVATELKDLAVQAVTLAGSFERSRVAWGVFLKDVEAGSQMFDRLYDVAQRTPLTFQGVESAAQMLKGFGLATEEIIPTLERMGDVARGNDETMQRLALAYGQALAQNRVLTRDLYQFVNAGVPIFEALSQVMEKSVHEVGILVSDGKVGFPEIEKALKALTDEGGQFHGMMEKTAETFEGKLSIAADNFKAVLSTIGRETIPFFKKSLDELNTTMDTMISKSNALYYLRTGQGDPNSLIAGLETIIARNTAMAENPLVKLTGFNWNIFHTAPDQQGGWQPLYSPLYENIFLQGMIDRIKEQQAAGGYAKAEQNRQGYRAASVPVASDRVPWRDILVEQKIPAYERPWVPTDQGTMVRGDLLSGTALVTQWLEQQKLGFENVRGTKFEEEFRKEFTRKAENLQEALLASGLWKVGESTVSVIDDYINVFGWKPTEKTLKPAEYTDRWLNKVGGGIPYMTQTAATTVLEQISASMALSAYQELSASASRVTTDKWMYKPGGGTQLLFQEQADTIIASIDARLASELRASLAESAKRVPTDRWAKLPGGGVPYLTQEKATSLLNDINNRIATDAAVQLSAMAARYKGDRWDSMPGGGVAFLSQEQADSFLSGVDNKILSSTMLALAAASKRAPADRWANKVGGGIAYLTQDEATAALDTIQASVNLSARIELEKAASRVSVDPYLYKAGGGISFLSPEAAQAITDSIDARIASGIRSDLEESANRAPTDRWLNKVGGGVSYLTPEQAQSAIDTISTSMLSSSRVELEAAAKRVPTDRWLNKPGGGTALKTPEEVQAELDRISSGMALDNAIYLNEAGSRVPLDKWMYKPGGGVPLLTPEQARTQAAISAIQTPAGLLRENMRAFEGAAPSGRWQERPIGINADTGDIAGYTVQQAYTDAEKYQEAQDNLTLSLANGKISTAGYKQALKELAEQYDPLTKAAISFGDSIRDTAINTLADEMYKLGDALVSGADGWESFGDAMGNTLETLLTMLPKLAIQVGLSMLGNGNIADDPLAWGLIAGGLIGQVGTGMLETNAKGGVYNSPSLSMFSNGVYDRPQVFTFAKGGVFAEAGPEAIMPLSRDSSGRLGVAAQSTGKVEVQVNNYSSTPISSKTKTVTDASGNRKIILTIRDMVRQEVATANAGGVRKS